MAHKNPEPIERLEEIPFHPADITLNALHAKGIATKKELKDERQELSQILNKIAATQASEEQAALQKELQRLKERVSKKHDELMEILKNEEKISRELQENKS